MNQRSNSEFLDQLILDYLQAKPQIKRWVIAYSGGLDSSVLLHLVVRANQRLAEPKVLTAVHINHALSPQADYWQAHCEKNAQVLGVAFTAQTVYVENQGQGIEAAAREQRYKVFASIVDSTSCLATGHHEDDQAETLVLRLARGAGVQGLSAMAAERSFDQGLVVRPLLTVPRHALEAYATAHNLAWITDESNADTVFDRNFVRHEVIPLLASRWQQVQSRLAATAERLQAAQGLLNDLAAIDLQQLEPKIERYGVSIDWVGLKKLKNERINNVLRYWCTQQQYPQPNAQQLQEINRQFLSQETMLTQASVEWGGCELRQFQKRLYLMPVLPEFTPHHEPILWQVQETKSIDLQQYGAGILSIDAHLPHNTIRIMWRKGGERCTPLGRKHSQQVKKLLQEYELETWLRDRVPLLYIGNELVAVADLWLCKTSIAMQPEARALQWSLPHIPNVKSTVSTS